MRKHITGNKMSIRKIEINHRKLLIRHIMKKRSGMMICKVLLWYEILWWFIKEKIGHEKYLKKIE